jgi:hypothetical protein
MMQEVQGNMPHPYRPIEEHEVNENERTFWTKEHLHDLVEQQGATRKNDDFGLLVTTITHDLNAAGTKFTPKPAAKWKKGKNDKKARPCHLATRRDPCFLFWLREGTDLSLYGLTLVRDNSSPDHWCLTRVRISTREVWAPISDQKLLLPLASYSVGYLQSSDQERRVRLSTHEVWAPTDQKLLLRAIHSEDYLQSSDQERCDTILLEKILLVSDDEPVTYKGLQIGSNEYDVHPKAAALFEFCGMTMEAQAEPLPPKGYDRNGDTETARLYEAVQVVYYSEIWDDYVCEAVNELQAVGYKAQHIETGYRDVLLSAMEAQLKVPEEFEERSYDGEEEDDDDELQEVEDTNAREQDIDVLIAGIEALQEVHLGTTGP